VERSTLCARRLRRGQSANTGAWGYGNDFYGREFWHFVQARQFVEKLALTAIEYPPMQDPISFNLEAVKRKVEEMIKNHPGSVSICWFMIRERALPASLSRSGSVARITQGRRRK
jgi:hypothetical protein